MRGAAVCVATLIAGGVPLDKSLKIIGGQSKNTTLKNHTLTLSSRIEEGFSFTEALKEFPSSFDQLFVSLISAGEISGELSGILEKIALHLEQRSKIQQEILGALIYPLVLIILALVIVGLLLIFVVPSVIEQFDTLNQELPLLTQWLIGLSGFIAGPAVWVFLFLLIVSFFSAQFFGIKESKKILDRILLRTPLLNNFLVNANLSRFSSSLSILRNSNVPVLQALSISVSTITNNELRNNIKEALTTVSEGDSIAKSLRKVHHIPPLVVQMIDSGEKSGELDEMLKKSSEYLDQEFQQSTKLAMNLLEPIVVVIMGSIVASIVVAVLLPLIQMNNISLIG